MISANPSRERKSGRARRGVEFYCRHTPRYEAVQPHSGAHILCPGRGLSRGKHGERGKFIELLWLGQNRVRKALIQPEPAPEVDSLAGPLRPSFSALSRQLCVPQIAQSRWPAFGSSLSSRCGRSSAFRASSRAFRFPLFRWRPVNIFEPIFFRLVISFPSISASPILSPSQLLRVCDGGAHRRGCLHSSQPSHEALSQSVTRGKSGCCQAGRSQCQHRVRAHRAHARSHRRRW
jgi:hypothetical protein